jgi:hypothetical protein
MARKFKSPIEIMLRNGIVTAAESQRVRLYDSSTSSAPVRLTRHLDGHPLRAECDGDSEEWGSNEDDADIWSLYGEVAIGPYRIDLLLEPTAGLVAIECDGHEFHDRTKQQAAYDRARDRELLKHGIVTIRFTGSEIHHSIARCVADVYDIGRLVQKHDEDAIRSWRAGHEMGERFGRDQAAQSIGSCGGEEHW